MSVRYNGNAANYLSLPSGLPNYNGPYTFLIKIKVMVDRNERSTFFNLSVGDDLSWDLAQMDTGGLALEASSFNQGTNTSGVGPTLTIGQWYMAAIIRESTTSLKVKLLEYPNLSLTTTHTLTTNVSGRPAADTFEIGRTHVNSFMGEPFNGETADGRFFTAVLSDEEIIQEAYSSAAVRTDDLFCDLPMATGATAGTDASGNGNHFTINGTLTTGADNPPSGVVVANAGFDQVRVELESVMLDSSQSRDVLGGAITRQWEQVSGTPVTLDDDTAINPIFTAPSAPATLEFKVTVEDDDENTAEDHVTVTIVDEDSDDWLSFTPQEAGFNPDQFYEAFAALPQPCAVARFGRIVGSKGDITDSRPLWSASKSVIALIFGNLMQDAVLEYSDVVAGTDNPTAPTATCAQMLSMLGDFGLSPHSPGSNYAYSNAGYTHFAEWLRNNFFTVANNVEFLEEALANALHTQDAISFAGFLSGWDEGFSQSTRDTLRYGQVLLNDGVWDGVQVISPQFISDLFDSQISGSASENTDYDDGFYNEAPFTSRLPGAYSFGFWLSHVRDCYNSSTTNEAIQAAGAFGTTLYVSREKQLLVCAVNVGGAVTNNDTVHISGPQFDAIADAVEEVFIAETGAFVETGVAAGLKASRVIQASTGSFASTGNAASLRATRQIQSSTGVFSEAGITANLRTSRSVNAAQGQFAETGGGASLLANRTLVGNTGTYLLTGNSADLLFGKTFAAEAGVFNCAGVAASLTGQRKLSASPGTVDLTGNNASLASSRAVAAQSGGFNFTGQNVVLAVARRLPNQPAAFSLTGQGAGVNAARHLSSQSGGFALSGVGADLRSSRVVTTARGSYQTEGNAAGVTIARAIPSEAGGFTLSGQPGALDVQRVLGLQAGAFHLAGVSASFNVVEVAFAPQPSAVVTVIAKPNATISVNLGNKPVGTITKW